jgi:hypothetical protein
MSNETKFAKLKFSYTNMYGDKTKVTKEYDSESIQSVGESELDMIVEQFNSFLNQAGFITKIITDENLDN